MAKVDKVTVKFRADMSELNEALDDALEKVKALDEALERLQVIRGRGVSIAATRETR